jgi:hypothetical protein
VRLPQVLGLGFGLESLWKSWLWLVAALLLSGVGCVRCFLHPSPLLIMPRPSAYVCMSIRLSAPLQERLKELCEDLLGPARWDPSMLPGAAGGRPRCEACDWTPTLLGLDKRTMLAQLVIPALAQERLPLAKEVRVCCGVCRSVGCS